MNSFTDTFWGEKNNGFFVLMTNMKHGQDSTKEFSDFLRESCSVEENYAKLLTKVAKLAASCHTSSKGTFGPFWGVIKTLIEKISSVHMQMVYSWQDLAKDVQRYNDEQHKKLKTAKDSETPTQEAVQGIQSTITYLQKAKETYHARRLEYEKVKRDNASVKDVEKVENKYKKAYDDYLGLVDKYAGVRSEFDSKMTESCQRFQEVEENHLEKMKDFVDTYSKAWEALLAKIKTIYDEFLASSAEMNVNKLLSMFIEAKSTGTEKPGPLSFEEADLTALPQTSTPDVEKKEVPILEKPRKDLTESATGESGAASEATSPPAAPPPHHHHSNKSSSTSNTPWSLPLRNTGWFLSKRKKKDKKKKKKEEAKSGEDDGKVETQQLDEEGYVIPPENRFNANTHDSTSSSDSDSDTEPTKIRVQIKPKNQNGAPSSVPQNTDMRELMKQAQGIRLSPVPNRRQTPVQEMTKSSSVSENMSRPGNDPFDPLSRLSSTDNTPIRDYSPANLSNSGLNSSATTSGSPDTGGRRTPGLMGILPAPPTGRSSTRQLGTIATARPGRQSPANTSTTSRGRQSPSPVGSDAFERADSVASLDRVSFNNNPYSVSRGPSPLTIGMSDAIPIAIAFSETVNALFRGQDTSKCVVKLTGEMMVSFPAGIIRVLTDNPNPAVLTFRLRNLHQLDNILVNKQLVEEGNVTEEGRSYSFIMPALSQHLRKQAEQTKAASYFNIDILKYQIKSHSAAQSTPLQLASHWKCEATSTDFRLDYSYNTSAMRTRLPLHSVTVQLPVTGKVTRMNAQPNAEWSNENQRAVWKVGEISPVNANGAGVLRARFELANGPSVPSVVAVQFLCEGATLSGLDFELTGSGYRVSLIKKRFITGKYISQVEPT